VVCRADLADDRERLACLLRLSARGGRLVVHGIDRSHRHRLVEYIRQQGPEFSLFAGGHTDAAEWLVITTLKETERRRVTVPSQSDHRVRLFLGLLKGDGYGWGVCSRYLIAELSNLKPIQVLNESDGTASNAHLNGPLFQALTDIDFNCMFPMARGRYNVGYTFFENELTDASVENAKRFDLVLGGSDWCRKRMLEKGVTNCGVLIQGIDPKVFYPIEDDTAADRFVIFSGGKFELRKGQDLVLRAVKIMQDKYPDVWLVNCWYNLWPASTRLMSYSQHIRFEHRDGQTWQETMRRTYLQNGLDVDRIETYDLIPQERQRDLYARTDIGLFPNRCEGGTNLVLMEYMACAKPVIVSNTSGHRDIVDSRNALLLNALRDYNVKDGNGNLIARWEEASLDEIVALLEKAYHDRATLDSIGERAGSDLRKFTWKQSAMQLLRAIDAAESF
jgi:glycosyltransferase involved in cell wall biosynthesis